MSWKRVVAATTAARSPRSWCLPESAAAMPMAATATTATAPSATSQFLTFMLLLVIEVRVEDADLRDPVHVEVVLRGGGPDRFRSRGVVDAEGLLLVLAHVRVEPGHTLPGVPLGDRKAQGGALRVTGNVETVREEALDDVAWHPNLLRSLPHGRST